MANSVLDIVRRAIRQQTVNVGSVVTNLNGASVGELGAASLSASQQWAYASVPGTQLPDLADFYALWQTNEAPQFQVLQPTAAEPGTVFFLESTPAVHLVAGGLIVSAGQLQFPLTIEVGQQSSFAIYLDGTLLRRGSGTLTQQLNLSEGRHTIELLFFAPSALISIPPTIAIVADALFVPVPQWASLTTDFADPVTGATLNRARFVNDSRVGGVRLLRRQTRPLGLISNVTELAADRTYKVQLTGDVLEVDNTTRFVPGEELYCQDQFLGYIVRATQDAGTTNVVLRMAPDQTPSIEPITGLMASVGGWKEVGRSGRTVVGGTTELQDRDVVLAERYDYCLQAWSIFNPAIWSAYSDPLSVRAGDVEAPGCLVLTKTPKLSNGTLTFFYHTPPDSDYAGVNVYQLYTRYLTVATAAAGSLTFEVDPEAPAIEDNTFTGWTIGWGTNRQRVLTQVGSTITFDGTAVPFPGEVLTLTKREKLLTDFGTPDTDDSLVIAAPTELVTFEFRTFDKSQNEQSDEDLEPCEDAYYVFDPAEFGRPTVWVQELNAAEQVLFGAPYDSDAYTIILVGATDAGGSSDGITVYYRINDGPEESFAASELPTFAEPTEDTGDVRPEVAAPYVVRGSGNSRYIALPRTVDISYIQIWAIDAEGVESRLFYFATSAPFVQLPTVEVRTQESATEATLTLRITDPTFRVAHLPLRDPTPTSWNGVEFAVQIGVDPFGGYEVTTPPVDVSAGIREYTKTVSFPTGSETVRIGYKVTAVQVTGEVDQIAQGIIPFTKGTAPGYPFITSTFDDDGTLQLELQGDSDTGSMQFLLYEDVRRDAGGNLEARRVPGGPYLPVPTRSELEALFSSSSNTSEVDGRFVEYDTGVVPTGLVWVAARSCSRALAESGWPGEITRNNAGEPDFTTRLFSQSLEYVAPKIAETFTEYVSAGRSYCDVTITVNDPQSRMRRGNGVVFRRMPGVAVGSWDPEPIAGWYSPAEQSGTTATEYRYTATVELFEGVPSRVAYAVIGEDERGNNDVVLQQRLVLAGLGAQPMIPQISGVVDADGRFAIILTGDSDTTSFKFAVATATAGAPDAYPTLTTVRTQSAEAGRVVRTNTLLTLTAEDIVYVTALAYNTDGLESEPAYYKAARGDIYIRPEVEEITDETTDRLSGDAVAYGVLQLKITDPQDRVTSVEFSGMSGADQTDWERTFDGTNYVIIWNAPSSVETIEPGVEKYVYQVRLKPDHLSRILYRVNGTRPDGSEGVLQTGTVTFDIGATPNILRLDGHIDSAGRYWPTFHGDTDCRSWVLAVKIGDPTDSAAAYPTITDVKNPAYPLRRVYPGTGAGLTQYPDPDGTPAPDFFRDSAGDPVIVPVGKMLFVTALAFATLSGGAVQEEYQSNPARYAVLRSLPYAPPQVDVIPSETGTSAQLKLVVKDPQNLMATVGGGVSFRRMAGRPSSWESAYTPVSSSGGSAETGFEYVSTASLTNEGTKIAYQVKALQPDGTLGLAASGVVSFSLSAIPAPPVLQTTLSSAGTLRVLVYGDSDASDVKVAFSTTAMPDAAAVDAAPITNLVNGQAIVTYGSTVGAADTIYIAARCLNLNVAGTNPSELATRTVAGTAVYVRPSVRETISETADTGSLVLTLVDPQQLLRSITFKRQSGTGAFESSTVSVFPPPDPATVTYTVPLVAQKTSRIQYELTGIREDGSEGLLDVGSITYRIGPNPGVPLVSALCSPNGQVTVFVTGDSDTLGARIAARKGNVRMTRAEILGPTPSGVARTAIGGSRELTWQIPLLDLTLDPTEQVSIGVIAYSDAACAGYESDIATFVEAREALYVVPQVDVVPSETDTLGTLTLNITDPQRRVQTVEVQTKSGRAGATAWSTIYSRGVSTATSISTSANVTLVEDISSWIAYRIQGTIADGTLGVLKNETLPFAMGRVPVAPLITVDRASDGAIYATFTGDSDTQSFRWASVNISSTMDAATVANTAATTVLTETVNGRTARVLSPGGLTSGNARLVVVQAASGSAGLGQLSATRSYAVLQPTGGLAGATFTLAKITNMTNATVTVTVTCSDGGQVRLSGVQQATLSSGAAVGTWVASGSTWVFNRHATLPGNADFEGGNLPNFANSGDAVYLPSQAEVVKPSLYITTRIVSNNAALGTITYGFTVKDPGNTGLSFTLQTAAEGLSGFTPVTTSISADVEYNIAVTQPAAGSSPAMLRVTASHGGNAVYPDVATVSVPAISGGLVGVISTEARITNITATQVTVQATSSLGQIRLFSQTAGTEVVGGGNPAGVWVGSTSATWIFARLASSAASAVFEGGNLAGYGNTKDTIYIPGQNEAAKPPLRVSTSITSSNPTTGQIVYSISVLDQNGSLANAVLSISASSGTSISSTGGSNGGSAFSLTVTMPTAGSGPGQVQITATNAAFYPDTANLTIPARGTIPLPTFTESTTEDNSNNGTLTVQSFDPYSQLNRVEMRTRAGNANLDAWSGWSTITGSFVGTGRFTYTQSTTMGDKRPGAIEWRAYTNADTFTPFTGGGTRFSPGRIPIEPEIYVGVNEDGSFNVSLVGDSDTVSFQYGFSLQDSILYPSASSSTPVSVGFTARLTNLGGTNYVPFGKTVVVAARGISSTGVAGAIAYGLSTRDNQPVTGKRLTLQCASMSIDFSSGMWQVQTNGDLRNLSPGAAFSVTGSVSVPIGVNVRRIGINASTGSSVTATLVDPTQNLAFFLNGGSAVGGNGLGTEANSSTFSTTATSTYRTVRFVATAGPGETLRSVWVEYDAPNLSTTI